MNLNEYGIFEYSKNGHSLDTLLIIWQAAARPQSERVPPNLHGSDIRDLQAGTPLSGMQSSSQSGPPA